MCFPFLVPSSVLGQKRRADVWEKTGNKHPGDLVTNLMTISTWIFNLGDLNVIRIDTVCTVII